LLCDIVDDGIVDDVGALFELVFHPHCCSMDSSIQLNFFNYEQLMFLMWNDICVEIDINSIFFDTTSNCNIDVILNSVIRNNMRNFIENA